MKITISLFGFILLATPIFMGGCASSQPKLTQEEILTQYPQVSSLNSAVTDSRAKGAELLAPQSYNKAIDSLESAMKAAYKGQTDSANEAAAAGLKVIDQMNRDTESNRKLLSEVIAARERAVDAGVIALQSEKLAELDNELKKTSTLAEKGDLEKAKQRRPKLIQDYTQLELATLKQSTADQAKSAIANAKKQGAKKYAPRTLARAEEEMALAVSILDADRTKTNEADIQARKAKFLAEQSASITETVKDFDRRDYTMEDVVLWHQSELKSINQPLGAELPFNEANEKVVLSMRNAIEQLKLAETRYQKQLHSSEQKSLALQQQESETKARFEKVQAMFTGKEANVYRQRQNVLISAHGFQFPSGQSEIQTVNFPLMNKIIRAINIFPGSRIEVTGHTDSTGTDNINQQVSQSRAGNVGKFLTEVGEIAPDRITTRGYGESRPVASNKTAAGRAENRRVEIKIINQ
ncbi:MAG: OmpA family protein [Gammaproteobacteria bacterium]|nr:OmpA family protein [Gammaproteobacteria bacterium]